MTGWFSLAVSDGRGMSVRPVHALALLLVLALRVDAATVHFVAEDLHPFHFYNDQGQPSGALVDVARAVAKRAELDASVSLYPFARALAQTRDVPNTFMMSLLYSEDRKIEFQWVGQVFHTSAILVADRERKDLPVIDSIDAAKNFRVATIRGYHAERYLLDHGFRHDINLVLGIDSGQLWNLLFGARTDFVLTNTIALDSQLAQTAYTREQTRFALQLDDFPIRLHLATGRSTAPELVEAMRNALSALKREGSLANTLQRWQLPLKGSDGL